MDFKQLFIEASKNEVILLIMWAVIIDTVFGVLRAMKDRKFNSCVGINGAIRKVGMILSILFLIVVDEIVSINLISFVPLEVRTYLNITRIGTAEFFGLLFIAYELVSILKNMSLCGLPVKGIWMFVKKLLSKYTTELPDDEEAEKTSEEIT